MSTTIKCGCKRCKGKPPILIPYTKDLRKLSLKDRQRAFLFAATGDITWLQYSEYHLPTLENRFIEKDEEE